MEIEEDYCDICHQKTQVNRKYYYYGIMCKCCGSKDGHFEIIKYCKNCEPKPPKWITIELDPFKESE